MMKEFREIFGNKDVHHQVTYHHKVENILHIQKQEKNFICVFMMNSFCSFFFFFDHSNQLMGSSSPIRDQT